MGFIFKLFNKNQIFNLSILDDIYDKNLMHSIECRQNEEYLSIYFYCIPVEPKPSAPR